MHKDLGAVVLFVLMYVLLNLASVVLVEHHAATIIQRFNFAQDRPQSVQLFAIFVFQQIIVLGIFALVYKRWKNGWTTETIISYFRERFKRKGRGNVFRRSVGWLIVYFLFSALLYWALNYFDITVPGLYGEQMVMTLLQSMSLEYRYDYVLIILLAVLIGPFVEELLFRGFLTDTLAKYWGFGGVLIAALLFAAAHMERGVVLNLAILSVFLGYIYRKTGSMRYSLLFHMGINGLAVIALIATQLYPSLQHYAN